MKAALRRICLPALAALFLVAQPALAQNARLEKALQRERRRADERRTALQELAAREELLAGQLETISGRMKTTRTRIAKQQAALDAIHAEETRAAELAKTIGARREQALRELRRLVTLLWPLEARGMQEGAHLGGDWGAADRHFQWNSAVYARARAKLAEVRARERQIAAAAARQRELAAAADRQLSAVNAEKDALLRDKLAAAARRDAVSSRRQSLEGELQSILGAIQDLNYQLSNERNRKFATFKAALPWPAKGRMVVRYAPGGRPARRGVGLATASGTPVRSVFWGKVVHNDVLRGLGRVVIVYHGDGYYSLYAYLADAAVKTGQEVEKDEPIGHAGFYPEAHGSGVYFELRFHQKPINPLMWLAPAR